MPAADTEPHRPRVCVLGGGFGGLYTAIKLELLMWPQGKKPKITLVDQGERFVFKPLLYELLNGTAAAWEVAPTFSQLLAPYPIQFVQDKVLSVQPEQLLADGGSAGGGTVQLASGAALPYDWLVVALGAASDARGVPGVRELARPFVSLDDAEFVAGRLAAFEARAATGRGEATVVIVGAGYAGVELAAVVGERMRGKAAVVLLTPGPHILDAAPEGQRQAADEALRSLGVSIVPLTKVTAMERTPAAQPPVVVDPAAAVDPLELPAAPAAAMQPVVAAAAVAAQQDSGAAAGADSAAAGASPDTSSSSSSSRSEDDADSYLVRIQPANGGSSSQLRADLVLWTAGSRAASAPLAPLPTDARGQLETDPTLRVLRHARVFALGDVSRGEVEDGAGAGGSSGSSGSFYPATAQVAFQQADYAAWNVWAGINGRALLPFRYQHLGDMMALGAANAAVALPLQLPPELAASISTSPLGSLLALAGLRLGGAPGRQQQQREPAAGAGAGVTLEGPLAQLLRRAAYLYRQPTNEQRLSVAASWVEQAVTAAATLAAEVTRPPPGTRGDVRS